MKIINKLKELTTWHWALGFVRGGLEMVMESDHLDVDWIKMPKDRWYADPFVLDVTDDEILLLVEDLEYKKGKGVITLLHINRATMEIVSAKKLLEIATHLSFPAIWRKDGHVYVYPESAGSGKLDMYEYDAAKEELTFIKTICDDVVWDSYITETFGEPLMFTAANDDYHLDIYHWDEEKERFIPYHQIASENPNSRMGGAVFEYKGEYYYPAQDCSERYGGATDIKKLKDAKGKVIVEGVVKHLTSPNPKYSLGLHTLNEYKGVVVIDVHGWRYGMFGSLVDAIKRRLYLFKNRK